MSEDTQPPALLTESRIGIIGAGVMAESIIAGLVARDMLAPERITASHPRAERRAQLEKRFGITVVEANLDAALDAGQFGLELLHLILHREQH